MMTTSRGQSVSRLRDTEFTDGDDFMTERPILGGVPRPQPATVDVAVIVAALRRDFPEFYVFWGGTTREFVALDRRARPWHEAAAHRDPNVLAAMLRASISCR